MSGGLLQRTLAVWGLLLVIANLNGIARGLLIEPLAGVAAGHVISTLLLSTAVFVLAWLTIRWIGPASQGQALLVGAIWLLLTVAFEFLAGRYLFGHPWERLLADYNVLQGRIWVLVLVSVFLAPMAAARGRGLVARACQRP